MNFLRQFVILLSVTALSLSAHAAEYFPPKISAAPAHDKNRWHSIAVHRAPNAPRITLGNKINPIWWFQNTDEPLPPKKYLPNKKFRTLKWRFRNSFHNFTYYVVGIADKSFIRSGRHPDRVFNPAGGWNVAIAKYKFLRLPFVSYHGKHIATYAGWRDRGNFGIKFNLGPRADSRPRATPPAN